MCSKLMVRYSLFFIFASILFISPSFAQEGEELSEMISSQLTQIQSKKINEKVYLHLDRRSFQSGEELWLKGYVYSNFDHKLSFLSKVLTVGLLNESEESVLETSFAIKGGRADGGINLPEELATGNYVLYAYSGWMKKDDESSVFYTQIQIENKNANALKAEITLDNDAYDAGASVSATLKVTDNDGEPVKKEAFTVTLSDLSNTYATQELKTDKDGKIELTSTLPSEVTSVIKMKLSSQALGTIEQMVIPMAAYEKVEISIMPEGGNLITEEQNTVAFKVVNFFGDPVDAIGKLIDDQGNEIQSVQSFYGGMGKFNFTPEPGSSYKLVTEAPLSTSTDLPQSVEALSLHLSSAGRDTLEFTVLGANPNNLSLYLSGVLNNVLYSSILLSPEIPSIKVPISDFPQGIAQFTLFADSKPISERLVFVNRHKSLQISTSITENEQDPKSEMTFEIQVTNSDGRPIKGNFSLAVADDYFARIGGQYQPSMISQMSLTSELKGKIPTPNYYFSNTSSYTTTALDLLMLTSGWRRYSWEYLFSNEINDTKEDIELEQTIATVVDKKGDPVPNVEVQIVNTTNFSAEAATTDAQGQFILSAQLVPQLENIYFKPPVESMEVVVSQISGYLTANLKQIEPWESYYESRAVDNISQDYFGDDYEILDAVVINSSKITEEQSHISDRYELSNQMSVKSHYYVESRTVDLLSFDIPILASPGNPNGGGFVDIVKQVTNIYRYNGNTGQLLLRPPGQLQDPSRFGAVAVLNGSLIGKDFRALNYLTSSQIEKVEVIKTSAMAIYYGSVASNGAVLVTTKKGQIDGVQPAVQQQERVTVKVNKEFYTPKYDSNGLLEDKQITDYRKTLHWMPTFNTDEFGKATINYFNDQAPKTATIIIQGTDGRGNMGYYMDQYSISGGK
ncbi:MAG: hypothetical protein RIF33_03070 [Cyclobacteriaceae bacterium]